MLKKAILKLMPDKLKEKLVHKYLDLDYAEDIYKDIVIKEAETKSELIQAFSLIQEEYKRRGVVDTDDSLRVTKYNLLPTTSVFVAKRKEKVIGTMSLILDSSLKLPIDKLAPMDGLRKNGYRIIEVSGLAVDHTERKSGNFIFMALALYCMNYAKYRQNSDYIVITINKKIKDLYKYIFLFKEIDHKKKEEYSFVNDSHAIPLILDNRTFPRNFHKKFGKYEDKRNVYKAIFTPKWLDSLHRKEFGQATATSVIQKRKEILPILIEKCQYLFRELTLEDIHVINSFYLDNEFLLKTVFKVKIKEQARSSIRIPVNFELFIYKNEQRIGSWNCREISKNGFSARMEDSIFDKKIVRFSFEDHDGKIFYCKGKVVWQEDETIGVKIIDGDGPWTIFYENTYNYFQYGSNKIKNAV